MSRNGDMRGFTLVEMLVVIAILGILMAMMVPAAGMIIKRAKISTAKGDAGIVATALLKYNAEYNRWPSTYAPDTVDTTDATWVGMMAPKPGSGAVPLNPKRFVFFEPGGGALGVDGQVAKPEYIGAFVDPWGSPFKFRLDTDGSGQIDHPNAEVGGAVRGRVLAWSAGPDGDFTTWADNVTGWE